jgi:hypothetical protein
VLGLLSMLIKIRWIGLRYAKILEREDHEIKIQSP